MICVYVLPSCSASSHAGPYPAPGAQAAEHSRQGQQPGVPVTTHSTSMRCSLSTSPSRGRDCMAAAAAHRRMSGAHAQSHVSLTVLQASKASNYLLVGCIVGQTPVPRIAASSVGVAGQCDVLHTSCDAQQCTHVSSRPTGKLLSCVCYWCDCAGVVPV